MRWEVRGYDRCCVLDCGWIRVKIIVGISLLDANGVEGMGEGMLGVRWNERIFFPETFSLLCWGW